MTDDIEFCPFCDASAHRLIQCNEEMFFCKACSRFFKFKPVKLNCLKCDNTNIRLSDFPMSNGEIVFQCAKCKKMYGYKDFFKYNKII
jgi:hypothetical protein